MVTFAGDIDCFLLDSVREDIEEFNATRGRRKRLGPAFVKWSEMFGVWRKYGKILPIEDWLSPDTQDIVKRMAHAVVRTMLRRRPRPERVHLDIVWVDIKGGGQKLLCRLMIPKRTVRLD